MAREDSSERTFEINDPISGDYKLVHLALDTLGYPPDNEPNDMDDWDDDIRWCRDGAIDQFNEMILKNNDIDGFIRAVQEAVASPLPIAERRPFSFSRS